MQKHLVFLATLATLGLAQMPAAQSAELVAPARRVAEAPLESARCPLVRDCNDGTCVLRRVCSVPTCPPGYPCYPLYGAYGPYGGAQYWGGFTSTGWGNSRWYR